MRAILEAADKPGSDQLDGDKHYWQLGGEVGFANVVPLLTRGHALMQQCQQGGALQVNLSAVQNGSSAMVAWMMDMKRESGRRGVSLTFSGVPEKVAQIIRFSALQNVLEY